MSAVLPDSFRPRRRKRRLVIVALLAAATMLCATMGPAWAAGESSPSGVGGRVVLRAGWLMEPDNLNPFIGYNGSSYEIWSLQYDYLFARNPDGTPGIQLATEWPTTDNGGISPDGRVWTVKIRSGVKWQDGEPLTAEDVAFS